MLCAVQGLLDKHGRENDKTPKGWKDGYHDLTPKSMKAAAAAGGAGGENGTAAVPDSDAEGAAASSPDGEKKKKKKKKDKVSERGSLPLLRGCVDARVFTHWSALTSPRSPRPDNHCTLKKRQSLMGRRD